MELKIKTEPCVVAAAIFIGIRTLAPAIESKETPIAIAAIVTVGIIATSASFFVTIAGRQRNPAVLPAPRYNNA